VLVKVTFPNPLRFFAAAIVVTRLFVAFTHLMVTLAGLSAGRVAVVLFGLDLALTWP
jgi:hypothetical protein